MVLVVRGTASEMEKILLDEGACFCYYTWILHTSKYLTIELISHQCGWHLANNGVARGR